MAAKQFPIIAETKSRRILTFAKLSLVSGIETIRKEATGTNYAVFEAWKKDLSLDPKF